MFQHYSIKIRNLELHVHGTVRYVVNYLLHLLVPFHTKLKIPKEEEQ